MKKTFFFLSSVLILLLLFVSCDNKKTNDTDSTTSVQAELNTETEKANIDAESSEIYGSYSRKNSNGFDSFTITLNADGTYTYYETFISSHIGLGKYAVDGNIITLIDDNIPTYGGASVYTFKFEYRYGKLIYLAEKSDQFMYVNLPDGATFDRIQTEQ